MTHPAAEQHRKDVASVAPQLEAAIRQFLEGKRLSTVGRSARAGTHHQDALTLKAAAVPAITSAVGIGARRVTDAVGGTATPATGTLAGALAWKFADQFTATTQAQITAAQTTTGDLAAVFDARVALAAVAAATIVSQAINAGGQYQATTMPRPPDKTWVVADANPCPTCAGVDGDTVPGNQDFDNGAPHGPIHPQCGCTIAWSSPSGTTARSARTMAKGTPVGLTDAIKAQFVKELADIKANPTPHVAQTLHRLNEWAATGNYPTGLSYADVKWMATQCVAELKKRTATSKASMTGFPPEQKSAGHPSLAELRCQALTNCLTAAASDATGNDTRSKPTPEDSQVTAALSQAKAAIARAKAAQLADPDNGTDPDDQAVLAQIEAMDAAADKAIAAQAKDGHDDPKQEKKSGAPLVPAVPKRAFHSLTERPVPVANLTVRMDADEPTANFVGYASTTGVGYGVHDWLGEYRETIAPGAFAKTLRDQGDIPLLFDHDGIPLASTASATSTLAEDQHGLRNEATLDRSDGHTNTICVQLQRGVLRHMSFSFRAIQDTWNDAYDDRSVNEAALYDTSVVTYPANPTTTAALRSQLRDALGREGVGVMWSVRQSLASLVERRFAPEADPVLEAALRALALADEITCRSSKGPYLRARTFLVAGVMEQARKGAVLSASNLELLNQALDALSSAESDVRMVVGSHTTGGGTGGTTGPAGANQDGATGGSSPSAGNPAMPADGAGPRSAAPSVVQTRALAAALRSGKR